MASKMSTGCGEIFPLENLWFLRIFPTSNLIMVMKVKRIVLKIYVLIILLMTPPGDTLIWDAHENRLYIDSRHDEYHAICYRLYQRECQTCPGFNQGQECTDAGDCIKCAINECACDDGFIGRHCEIPRTTSKKWLCLHFCLHFSFAAIPDKDIVVYGGDNDGSDSLFSNKANTISETSCALSPVFCSGENCQDLLSTYIFDSLITCGGSSRDYSVISQQCKKLDCIAQEWQPLDPLPAAVALSAETIIKKKSKDEYWWLTGGTYDGESDRHWHLHYRCRNF